MRILFIILISFSSLKGVSQLSALQYKTNKFNVAIFPADIFELLPSPRFTPSKEQVLIAEQVLKKYCDSLQKTLPNSRKNKLKSYRRQYFGYIDSAHHHILYINFLPSQKKYESEDSSWLKHKIEILDAGGSFLNALFDIDSRQITHLAISMGYGYKTKTAANIAFAALAADGTRPSSSATSIIACSGATDFCQAFFPNFN